LLAKLKNLGFKGDFSWCWCIHFESETNSIARVISKRKGRKRKEKMSTVTTVACIPSSINLV
jgi:hypothetical protein